MTNKPTPASPALHRFDVTGRCIDCDTHESYNGARLTCPNAPRPEPSPARSDMVEAELILQARSPEGDPWQAVSHADFIKASVNGYETRVHLARAGQNSVFYELAASTQPASNAQERPTDESVNESVDFQSALVDLLVCVKNGGHISVQREKIQALTNIIDARRAASATSGESVDTPEFRRLLKEDRDWQDERTAARLIAHIDARRATAGTTAAPTDAEAAEGGASALRAEPAGQHGANPLVLAELRRWAGDDPGYAAMLVRAAVKEIEELEELLATRCRAEGGVTCNSASQDLATSAAAPGDFWQWLARAYRDGDKGDEPRFTKYNMEAAFQFGIASNAGAAPGKPLAHGHRDDWYLMANARRIGMMPIRQVANMTNWSLAHELFATGSNSSHQICVDAGIDPTGYTVGRAPSDTSPVGQEKTNG